MAFLLPFIPAIAEVAGIAGTGAVAGGAGYLTTQALKKAGFKKGGIVSGAKGAKKLIVAHGGEMILPVEMVKKVKTIMKRTGIPTTIPKINRPSLGVKPKKMVNKVKKLPKKVIKNTKYVVNRGVNTLKKLNNGIRFMI